MLEAQQVRLAVIDFVHVSKRYDLGVGRGSLRDALGSFFTRRASGNVQKLAAANDFFALRDVTFQVRRGEILGLVGANGAGKSTVLKLLSKVTSPTMGRIKVNGRVSALIELGAGFHGDLNGRENAYLSGSIFGMSRREIDERLPSIVDFAELHDFIEIPVKRYSSGMYARLGFAIAVHVDPEILLVDEVLAVGDVKFRDKCAKQIDDFRRRGKTMVVVSHDRHMIERLCDHALLLSRGQVIEEGPVGQVMETYYRHRYEGVDHYAQARARLPSTNGHDARPVEITNVTLSDQHGQERAVFLSGERMVLRVFFRVNAEVTDPVFYCDVCHEEQLLNGNNSSRFNVTSGHFGPGDTGVVEVSYDELNLLEGQYYVRVGATQDISTQIKYHVVEQAALFEVTSSITGGFGLVNLPQRWSVRANPAIGTSSRVVAVTADRGE